MPLERNIVNMNEKRYKSIIAIWGILLLILQGINFISMIKMCLFFMSEYYLIPVFVSGILIAMVILFTFLSLIKKKAGLVIGIIIGAIYIIPLNIINILIGVCLIISCIYLLKELSKE